MVLPGDVSGTTRSHVSGTTRSHDNIKSSNGNYLLGDVHHSNNFIGGAKRITRANAVSNSW